MLETCLIALLAGAFFGWVFMRGWGWLCVAFICFLAADTCAATRRCYLERRNTSGATAYTRYRQNTGSWSSVTGVGNNQTSETGPFDVSAGTTFDVQWSTVLDPFNSQQEDHFTAEDGEGNQLMWSYFTGAPATTNICTASLHLTHTETDNFPQYWIVYWIDLSPQSPITIWQGYLQPDGSQDVSVTWDTGSGHCPGVLTAYGDRRGLDTTTNLTANSTNDTRQLTDPANTQENSGDLGTPSTNSLTQGDVGELLKELRKVAKENTQQASTNLIGVINGTLIQIRNNQVVASNLLHGIQQNTATTASRLSDVVNNTSYLTNLPEIATNTAVTTNLLGPQRAMMLNYMAMTNWLETNAMTGALSNNAAGEGMAISNAVGQGVLSRAGPLTGDMTNVVEATEQDRSVWMMPVRTNVLSTAVTYIDLNPLNNPLVAGLMGWFRFGVKFWIQYLVFMYIYGSIKTSVFTVTGLEPGGPGRGGLLSILWYLKQNLFWGALLASIPVLLLGALDSYFIQNPWVSCPFTSLGVESAAGAAAPYVRAGLDIVQGMFPLTFALSTLVWVFIWDVTQFGHVLFLTRLVKAVG